MNGVNYDDMKKMQAAAEMRVSEMNRRSRQIVDSYNGKITPKKAEAPKEQNRFRPVNDAPKPKNIKMPVEYPQKPHFVYEPPQSNGTKPTVPSFIGTGKTYNGLAPKLPILGNLSRDDTERLFLLSLCMLLKNEKADEELITALMYLMT